MNNASCKSSHSAHVPFCPPSGPCHSSTATARRASYCGTPMLPALELEPAVTLTPSHDI